MKKLKIKICGMRDPGNIREISALSPDYMGFIFYPPSKRFIGELSAADLSDMPENIRRAGVFVNMTPEDMLTECGRMKLDAVQLHGSESPDVCKLMKQEGLEVIKAFNIAQETDFDVMRDYLDACDMFLLDTAGPGFGGTGLKFNWNRLRDYNFDKPFMLSGGVGPADAEEILSIDHPRFYGIDLNSRFELEPGMKDGPALAEFVSRIRTAGDQD